MIGAWDPDSTANWLVSAKALTRRHRDTKGKAAGRIPRVLERCEEKKQGRDEERETQATAAHTETQRHKEQGSR